MADANAMTQSCIATNPLAHAFRLQYHIQSLFQAFQVLSGLCSSLNCAIGDRVAILQRVIQVTTTVSKAALSTQAGLLEAGSGLVMDGTGDSGRRGGLASPHEDPEATDYMDKIDAAQNRLWFAESCSAMLGHASS